jgi:hypothetical protein
MSIVVFILVFCLVLFFLTKNLQTPPPPETENDLRMQGYSVKEAKQEARAQRAEQRDHSRVLNSSVRTANNLGKTAYRISKKVK